MTAVTSLNEWYLWTAIIAALLVIGAGLPKTLRAVGRFVVGTVVAVHAVVRFVQAIPELLALIASFPQHVADDAAFQSLILKRLDERNKP